MKYIVLLSIVMGFQLGLAQEPYYFEAQPQEGEGIYAFLARFNLNGSQCNFNKFYALNDLTSRDPLFLNVSYKLPVKIYKYNGTSIRSTIGNDNYANAVNIQKYNLNLLEEGIRQTDYRLSNILWVPYQYLHCEHLQKEDDELIVPYFGKEHERVAVIDHSLKDRVYYLVSGHGGPDPGAMGKYRGHDLCEDEYAYDVILRLARKLMEHGAKVYVIMQDPDDGIRDEKILECDYDELVRGESIPLDQVARLHQRTDYINDLYYTNLKKNYIQQTAVMIHVDSRPKNQRLDVFFMYYKNSERGKLLASNLRDTFEDKYQIYRQSGDYYGHIDTRNLYVLRETVLPGVFIELGNIRNSHDQKRLILKSNRQALADWIYLGLIRAIQSQETHSIAIN